MMTLIQALVMAVFAVHVLATPQSSILFNFGNNGTSTQTASTDNPFNFGTVVTSSSASMTTRPTTTHSVVTPKAPVITITVPGGYDDQVLVGSLIGTASSLYTVAITCAEGTNLEDCGLSPAITVTAGPATYHYQVNRGSRYIFEVACSFSSAGGSCINANIGVYSGSTEPESGRQIATRTFNADYLTKVQVYVTAGQTSGLVVSSTATAGSVSGSGNGVPTLAPNAAAAGLVGLAALLF